MFWPSGVHPMMVLFVAAVVVTLWSRLLSWCGRDEKIPPRQLHQTIVIVAVASPGESVDPYVQMLHAARWPSRVSLHLFKMLGPQEEVDETAWGVRHGAVRLVRRYGAFDRANERMRLLRATGSGTEFVLLLGEPVEADAGWDDLLLRMFSQCTSPAALTTTPRSAQQHDACGGTFLCIDGSGAVSAQPFASAPRRPQPSLFASAQMCFGPTELIGTNAPRGVLNVANEDVVLSQALWMAGVNLFAPQALPFRVAADPVARGDNGPRHPKPGAWDPPERAVRTAREWALFCGKKESGAWSRRARLGLTPHATHEERYAKHGTALELHGIA